MRVTTTGPARPDEPARRAARHAAAALAWAREAQPGGVWASWVFTVTAAGEGIGPRIGPQRLSPGTPSAQSPLAALVARTSGIRDVDRGLALVYPADLVDDRTTTGQASGRPPLLAPRRSGHAVAERHGRPVLAASVQLRQPTGWALLVDDDRSPDPPFDPRDAQTGVVFTAPNLVPALLRRAVLGPEATATRAVPAAGALLIQSWLARVIWASTRHGPDSDEVAAALAQAPDTGQVETATLAGIHDRVVGGALPGLAPDEARWAGPELTAQILAGVYGSIPRLLATAGEQWPKLGARLSQAASGLLP
jgi:hypothetical protein